MRAKMQASMLNLFSVFAFLMPLLLLFTLHTRSYDLMKNSNANKSKEMNENPHRTQKQHSTRNQGAKYKGTSCNALRICMYVYMLWNGINAL